MDCTTLAARFEALLEKQRKQAIEWHENPYYTHDGHNVGDDVGDATAYARRAFKRVMQRTPPWTDAAALHAALTAELAREHAAYSASPEEADPDGYGSATFHEIRRDLAALAED